MIKKFDKSFNGVTLDGSRLHRLVLSSNPNYGAFRHVSNYDWLHLEKPVPQKPEQMEWFRVTSGSVQAQAYTAQLHYQIGEQTQYAYNAGQFVIFDTLTYDRTQFNPAYCNYHIDQYLKLANPTHYVIVKETQSHLHFHTFLFYDHLDERYLKCPNHGRPGPRRKYHTPNTGGLMAFQPLSHGVLPKVTPGRTLWPGRLSRMAKPHYRQ